MARPGDVVAETAELQAELEQLRSELARQERESASKERQLQIYAAELRETYKQERRRRQELQASYMATVRALSNAVEARDAYTAKHAERVAAYGLEIAREMALDLARDPATEFGFLLHDVGKVAVSDRILHKPGPLTPAERREMERHPVVGAAIVSGIEFLGAAAEVVRHHHERWDGSGYPDGLAGEEIPLAARVFAVADVLDALTTDRPYRSGMTLTQARELIVVSAASHFDPAVVESFKLIPDSAFTRIAEELR
jgi:ribonuclease P protein subunit RPR2